jgi:hypothetical protein
MGRRLIYIRPAATGYLPLTTAWIAATLETDTTILNALNTFEAGLIANSLTGKFNALYPFVGGTSGKHTFNFMNTAQFQLSFVGSWTHSSGGATPFGTNSHADTTLVPSTTLSLNNTHLSVYTRTNTNVGVDIGVGQSVPTRNNFLATRSAGSAFATINQINNSSVATADSLGHFVGSRTGATTVGLYKNGSSILAATEVSTILPSVSIYLGARRFNATVDSRAARQLAFATVGSGLTAGEISTLYTLIQAFQTSLSPSRNV